MCILLLFCSCDEKWWMPQCAHTANISIRILISKHFSASYDSLSSIKFNLQMFQQAICNDKTMSLRQHKKKNKKTAKQEKDEAHSLFPHVVDVAAAIGDCIHLHSNCTSTYYSRRKCKCLIVAYLLALAYASTHFTSIHHWVPSGRYNRARARLDFCVCIHVNIMIMNMKCAIASPFSLHPIFVLSFVRNGICASFEDVQFETDIFVHMIKMLSVSGDNKQKRDKCKKKFKQ